MNAHPGYVYFMADHQPGCIYIGHTGTDKLTKRIRAHQGEARELLAVLPGTGDGNGTDEHQIHAAFARHKVEGRPSVFDARDVWDYVGWLKARRFATANPTDAPHLHVLPFDIWRPGRMEDPWVEVNGQMRIAGVHVDHERLVRANDLVHLSSVTDEWLTPPDVIDRARATMGSIDTDPATCAIANAWIGARLCYSKAIDGLNLQYPWEGNVWLNPPYGQGQNSAGMFCTRLIRKLEVGNVTAAITCLNLNSAGAHWFDHVWAHATRHLIWRGRIDFISPDNSADSSPSKGTILSYFGGDPAAFDAQFKDVGTLLVKP